MPLMYQLTKLKSWHFNLTGRTLPLLNSLNSVYSAIKNLEKLLTPPLGDVNIEDAYIPLAIIACDIATGEKITLTSGPLSQAIMASSALPGAFNPVEINDRLLVDGGIVENVPVSALRALGANSLIAVDLSEKVKYNEPNDIFDVISNANFYCNRSQYEKPDTTRRPNYSP